MVNQGVSLELAELRLMPKWRFVLGVGLCVEVPFRHSSAGNGSLKMGIASVSNVGY